MELRTVLRRALSMARPARGFCSLRTKLVKVVTLWLQVVRAARGACSIWRATTKIWLIWIARRPPSATFRACTCRAPNTRAARHSHRCRRFFRSTTTLPRCEQVCSILSSERLAPSCLCVWKRKFWTSAPSRTNVRQPFGDPGLDLLVIR